MNAMNFFATVITSVMISVNANANTVKNTKTAEPEPAAVEITKAVSSCSLVRACDSGFTYKYEYKLDSEGRVVNRITFAWDEDSQEWSPLSAYSVVFTPTETILSYAKYNKATKTYSKDAKQTRYNASEYPIIFNVPE